MRAMLSRRAGMPKLRSRMCSILKHISQHPLHEETRAALHPSEYEIPGRGGLKTRPCLSGGLQKPSGCFLSPAKPAQVQPIACLATGYLGYLKGYISQGLLRSKRTPTLCTSAQGKRKLHCLSNLADFLKGEGFLGTGFNA